MSSSGSVRRVQLKMREKVVVCALIAASLLGARAGAPADSSHAGVSLADSAVTATQHFLAEWHSAWIASQREQHTLELCGVSRCPTNERVRGLHCHREKGGAIDLVTREPERLIGSRNSWFAVCPSWYPSSPIPDERDRIDYALTASQQQNVRQARATLIETLARAAHAPSANDFVAGQLVRFLVDQGDLARAASEADRCAASRWWCGALRAYVTARAGATARADSLYLSAISLMPDSVRCAWTDIRPLTDSTFAAPHQSCATSDTAQLNAWWLADPLYIEPGNERRVEQYVRHTILALHTALDRDERYDWRAKTGNDARAVMIERYGWPSYTHWRGFAEDSEHTDYLMHPKHRWNGRTTPANEPYTTYEYTQGRLHTFPDSHALSDPLHAQSADWTLTERQKINDPLWPEHPWWPREHFAPHAPLVQLSDPQTAMLRRDNDVILAVATELDESLLRRSITDRVDGVTLVVSPRRDSILVVDKRTGIVGTSTPLWGHVASSAALVGLEFPARDRSTPGGRTRYSVQPPPPLSTMQGGELAISNPIVLHAVADGTVISPVTDSALTWMAGSLHVKPVGRIGIYWETYGFQPTDTIEFSVWIERHTPQGIVRRFANSVRITTDLNTPVATSWIESDVGRVLHVIPGRVPIIGRTIAIDVSALAKGAYWLDVAAKASGREAVRGRTEIVIE